MASSGVMTQLFADALVLTEAHVAARYRALREAGLVTKGGRGRFAPNMSCLDGARLLIALMGAQAISETEAATQIFGDLIGVIYNGEDDPLADDLSGMNFETAISKILESCLAYRLGDAVLFERWGRDLTITVSQTGLTATITRTGFAATFQPCLSKSFPAGTRLTDDMAISDRLWLRSDRTGLQTFISVDTIELLELAPALGPVDSVYLSTH